MKNEKDENVIHNLFAEFHYADDLGVIKSKLAEYVATIRAEEREAAFKEAADYVRIQWLAAYPVEVFPEPPPVPAQASRDSIAAAQGRHMAKKIIEYLEATATREKE